MTNFLETFDIERLKKFILFEIKEGRDCMEITYITIDIGHLMIEITKTENTKIYTGYAISYNTTHYGVCHIEDCANPSDEELLEILLSDLKCVYLCNGCNRYRYDDLNECFNMCRRCSRKFIRAVPDYNCSICTEPLRDLPCLQTICKHHFHIKCMDAVKNFKWRDAEYEACEREYDSDDARYIYDYNRDDKLRRLNKKCPLCRAKC